MTSKLYNYKNKSIIKSLKQENKINNQFLTVINSICIEDLMAIKLELSSTHLNNRLYGFDLWRGFQHITKEALLKFAISVTSSKKDAARLLGLTYYQFQNLYKKYNISHSFDIKDIKKETI